MRDTQEIRPGQVITLAGSAEQVREEVQEIRRLAAEAQTVEDAGVEALEMLIERRARAQERRVVPETIARFIREAAEFVPLTLKTIPSLPHTFEPARTPSILRRYEKDPDWKLREESPPYGGQNA